MTHKTLLKILGKEAEMNPRKVKQEIIIRVNKKNYLISHIQLVLIGTQYHLALVTIAK
jgi:hypothetical protein